MWSLALELNEQRQVTRGDTTRLCDAIRRGADLRVGTAFRHNEHIDTASANDELILERMDFRVTYLIGDSWTAGIENLRMPVALPDGFGPRASMSFFLYNQDGNQAIARPFLDGPPVSGPRSVDQIPAGVGSDSSPPSGMLAQDPTMPRMQILSMADTETNAPSHHFIYDFDYYRFFVCDRWREVLAHDEQGAVISGSFQELVAAVQAGCEVKVAIRGLCSDLGEGPDHEVFVHTGPCYEYTRSGFLIAAAQPLVRARASMPLIYRSHAWDFGWVTLRTDGSVARWLCDPYTLRYNKSWTRHALRWFVDDLYAKDGSE